MIRILHSIKWIILWAALVAAVTVPLYLLYGKANIKQTVLTAAFQSGGIDLSMDYCLPGATGKNCSAAYGIMKPQQVSFLTYLLACMVLPGWLALTIFGGYGMLAMPLDFLFSLRHRPQRLNRTQYTAAKAFIAGHAEDLLVAYNELVFESCTKSTPSSLASKDHSMHSKNNKNASDSSSSSPTTN